MTALQDYAGVLDLLAQVPRPPAEKGWADAQLDLLAEVPRPPLEQDWAGASDAQLAALEQELGFDLPAAVRAWLSVCNGSMAGPGGLYGTATTDPLLDIAAVLGRYPRWKSTRWIPVAGDGNGNHYVVDASRAHLDGDAVFFVDAAENPDALTYIAASSLPHFLLMLLSKELGERRWPFRADFVLAADPRIAAVDPGSLLPWAG